MKSKLTTKIDCHIKSYIGGRKENQDSAGYFEAPIGTVIVVCDGMGAMNGGSVASSIAVRTIIDYIAQADADASVPEVLSNSIILANNAILDAAEDNSELTGMGTTVTAMIINDDCATVSYLGDSRIYQLRGKEKVFRTFDHSFVFQSVAMGLITEEQARLSSQSNVIIKALGIKRDIDVEVFELPYLAGDRFVLCTDGFWGSMPEKELISRISKRSNILKVLETTSMHIDMEGVRQGGHHDNLTAAMFDVKKDSLRKTKMSKKVKLLFAAISLMLAASLFLNVYQYVKHNAASDQENAPKSEVPKDKPNDQSGEEGSAGNGAQ